MPSQQPLHVQHTGPVLLPIPGRTQLNAKLVNNAIYKTSTRPYAFSTMSPYTSWDSLTDRTFSGRHLPEATTDPDRLPPVDELVDLFHRGPAGTILSDKSTLLFPYFA